MSRIIGGVDLSCPWHRVVSNVARAPLRTDKPRAQHGASNLEHEMSSTDVADAMAKATGEPERKPRPGRKASRGAAPAARAPASTRPAGAGPRSPLLDVWDGDPLTEEERAALAVARGYPASGPSSPLDPRLWPDLSDVETEDDEPVDSWLAEKEQRLLTEPLYGSWEGPGDGRPFVAMANVGLFYRGYHPPVVPDAMLSLDVETPDDFSITANQSYFTWVAGKPPDVVIEIVSKRPGGEGDRKLELYAQIGVPYYVIHDPYRRLSQDLLRVYRLVVRHYERMADGRMPEVGLSLALWEGKYEGAPATWLRWHDLDGVPIPTSAERVEAERRRAEAAAQRAEAEAHRAEAEAQRAEEARQRAETAEAMAARLAARLRALGVDPDGEPSAG